MGERGVRGDDRLVGGLMVVGLVEKREKEID